MVVVWGFAAWDLAGGAGDRVPAVFPAEGGGRAALLLP